MPAEPFIIRPARPDDAQFMAWLILTAGRAHVQRGIWEVVLGLPQEQCLGFLSLVANTKRAHLFHHSCYLLAEMHGRPVAGLGGYDPTTHGYPALREALPEVFAALGAPPMDQGGERMRILDCIPEGMERAWVIDSVATLPDYRRRGIVDKLLEQMLEVARKRRFPLAQLSIYLGNTPAQRAYEKHGFKVITEKRDAYFEEQIGSPGMALMLRQL